VEEVDVSPEVVEYAIYGAEGELPDVGDLHAAAGAALVEVSTSTVADDWSERWREFHRPLQLRGMRLRAPWHEPVAGPEVVIDPGQAFGTGAHPTTRLCLELLLDEPRPSGALVDLGCGSGVLAIAAAKLGWGPVDGFDHEAESVEATADNAAVNDVTVGAHRWDLRDDPIPTAPTMTANLLRPLLLLLAERMTELPETLIASGLLVGEADEVAAAFPGMREVDRRVSGEWAAVLLRRQP
jgi:ribosomal protein L11 methyltransferase